MKKTIILLLIFSSIVFANFAYALPEVPSYTKELDPDTDNKYYLGTTSLRYKGLNALNIVSDVATTTNLTVNNSITLGGETRTTWPTSSSGVISWLYNTVSDFLYPATSTSNVAIGTTTPDAKLAVEATSSFPYDAYCSDSSYDNQTDCENNFQTWYPAGSFDYTMQGKAGYYNPTGLLGAIPTLEGLHGEVTGTISELGFTVGVSGKGFIGGMFDGLGDGGIGVLSGLYNNVTGFFASNFGNHTSESYGMDIYMDAEDSTGLGISISDTSGNGGNRGIYVSVDSGPNNYAYYGTGNHYFNGNATTTGTVSFPNLTASKFLALDESNNLISTDTPSVTVEETDPIWSATSSNYFTLADWFSTTTDQLTEGLSNLYYTQARAWSDIWASSTLSTILGKAETAIQTETDPVFMSASTSLPYQPIGSYLTEETDPVFTSSFAHSIASSTNWDTAYSWGNHALAGYLTNLLGGLNAILGNSTTTNATSTNLYVSGQTRLGSLNGLLKATTGVIGTAVAGVDYVVQKDWAVNGNGRLAPTSTISVEFPASIYLPTTASTTNAGIIYQDEQTFIHSYYDPTTNGGNFSAGRGAGNLTMGYSDQYGANGGSLNTLIGNYAGHSIQDAYDMTCVGTNACFSATSSIDSTHIGTNSGYYVTSGFYNTSVGEATMLGTPERPITGGYNDAFGVDTLTNLGSGSNNTSMGRAGMYYLTTGNRNSSLGNFALAGNIAGNDNTGVGYFSLVSVNGNGNVALGANSGDSLVSGDGNIVIGYDVDVPSDNATNTLNIGNLIFGTGLDGRDKTISSGKIGIGTTTPATTLDVYGTTTMSNGLIPDNGRLYLGTDLDGYIGYSNSTNNYLVIKPDNATTTGRVFIDGILRTDETVQVARPVSTVGSEVGLLMYLNDTAGTLQEVTRYTGAYTDNTLGSESSRALFKTFGSGSTVNSLVAYGFQNGISIGSTAVPNAKLYLPQTTATTTLRINYSGGGDYHPIDITSNATVDDIYVDSGAHLTSGGVWSDASSIDLKENFENMTVLDKLSGIDVTKWNYKAENPSRSDIVSQELANALEIKKENMRANGKEEEAKTATLSLVEKTSITAKAMLKEIPNPTKHFSPYAEQFNAIFGLGDSKSIAPKDLAGVALQGVKELLARMVGVESRVTALEKQNAELRKELEEIKVRLK